MSIKAGSYLTVNVQGHAGLQTPDDLARQVTSYLQSSGQVDVSKNHVNPARDIVSDLLAGNWLSWDYIADVTVRALYDDDNADAFVSLVRQAFADVTGNAPTGALLEGASTKGAPTADTPESGLLHALGLDAFARGLQTEINFVLLALVALIVVIVFAVSYGPNVPKLATVRL